MTGGLPFGDMGGDICLAAFGRPEGDIGVADQGVPQGAYGRRILAACLAQRDHSLTSPWGVARRREKGPRDRRGSATGKSIGRESRASLIP